MLFFRAVAGGISAGALSGAMLFGATGSASADPTPAPPAPNCTAADLAAVSAGVSAAPRCICSPIRTSTTTSPA